MAIKQIGVYNGSGWDLEDIGASASNITLNNQLAGSNNLQTVLNNILPTNKLTAYRVVKVDENGRLSTFTNNEVKVDHIEVDEDGYIGALDITRSGHNAILRSVTAGGTIQSYVKGTYGRGELSPILTEEGLK